MVEDIIIKALTTLHGLTDSLRGFIAGLAPEYVTIILLALSMIGGYFLVKKMPNFLIRIPLWVLYGLIFFLLLRLA